MTPEVAVPAKRRSWVLRVGLWASLLIAAAVVIRRIVALAKPAPSGPPEMTGLDRVFASHAALTLAHIVPALLFVLLIPAMLFRKPGRLNWIEPLFFLTGGVVGVTAFAMSRYAVGGWTERSAVFVFDSLFLYSLWRAFRAKGAEAGRRRWLLRSIIILLGIATTRPVMAVFFATSTLTHLEPRQFFGWAFWIGFSINAALGEFWILRRRSE